jgi:hypothetical protein
VDEMSMVRRLLTEPPPGPHVVAKGRERLVGSTARRTRETPTTTRAALRSALVLGITSAAAVAALAVAALVPGAGTSRGGGDPAVTDGSARSVLLAVAARAEATPTRGTYWHTRTLSSYTWPEKLGDGEDRYVVERLSVHEQWTKRNGHAWSGSREWVRPKTPEDEVAWRRDGSPSRWCVGFTDTEPRSPICLHTAPGTASIAPAYHAFEVAEGRELTFEQLQQLPQKPEALRAWVVGAVKDDLDPSASPDVVDLNVAEILANLLVDVPVPPGVRAAAYRALADMPNVKSVGPTRDELGRAGVGIVIDVADRSHVVVPGGRPITDAGELTLELVIDPDTSYVLANQMNVANSPDPIGGTLILEVGWTDEEPHEPTLP